MHDTLTSARGSDTMRERVLSLSTNATPTRWGQIALGVAWCIDGLFKLQPYFFHHFADGVIDPNASGQPGVIGKPIAWVGEVVGPHQAIFVVLAALAEISIGIGLLVPRTVKPALALSFVWALNVWWTGEGLGGLFTSNTPDPLSGILGTAPIYIFAGLLVWPRGVDDEGRQQSFGLLGERGARYAWAALWLGAAALWIFPSNAHSAALRATLREAPAGAHWLSSLHSSAASAVGGSGTTIALVLAVASAEIGLAVLFRRGVRLALFSAMFLLLAFWVLGEGFGGAFTGQATDVGTAPLMILVAALLLPLEPRSATPALSHTIPHGLGIPQHEMSPT